MARCVPLPSPIPRCHICCAKGAANSVSAPAATTPGESVRSPEFLQGTLFYGLTAGFTLYGGTQLARDYQAWALGLGRGFGEFGSLGGCHQAVTRTPSGKRYTGHSLRAQYQKNFVSSGTAFSLASYRYSSSGYYDFAEASALESARASRQPASPGRAVGVAKPWWHRQSGGFRLVAGVLASAESG